MQHRSNLRNLVVIVLLPNMLLVSGKMFTTSHHSGLKDRYLIVVLRWKTPNM